MNHIESQSAHPAVLADYLVFRNGKTPPGRADNGRYEVFGSNGAIGRSDFSNADGPLIVIGRVGSYCGSLFYSTNPAWVSDNAIVCTAKDRPQSRFWYYALEALSLNRRSGGSGQPLLNQQLLGSILYAPPAVAERIAIAEVLGAFDDKIAANRKLSATAAQLADTRFRLLMSSASVAVKVGSLLTLEYGKPLTASCRTPGTVEVFGSGGVVGVHGEALHNGPGVIVGRKGTSGAVHWAPGPYYPIDTTFYVAPVSDAIPLIFCYFLLRSLRLGEMNSDSAVPGLNRNEAHGIMAPLPGMDDIRTFAASASILFENIGQLRQESRTLVTMRDALLPQLMSGKIRVKDAEKTVEEVL